MKKYYKLILTNDNRATKNFLKSLQSLKELKNFIVKRCELEKAFNHNIKKIEIVSFVLNDKKECLYKNSFLLKNSL